MFCVVDLKHSETIIIPRIWCQKARGHSAINNGINFPRKLIQKVFYSNNLNEYPDFSQPLKEQFDSNSTACYQGKLMNIFGKSYFIVI